MHGLGLGALGLDGVQLQDLSAPAPPAGYIILTDDGGAVLLDDDGAILIEEAA